MVDDVYKILGFGIALVGSVITIMRGNSAKFKEIHTKVDTNSKDAISKIDDVKKNYVRRDDFATHITHIEKAIEQQAENQKDFQREIKEILNGK